VIGTIILFSTLNAPTGWHPEKTDLERQQLLVNIRDAERLWARRCAYALAVLAVFITIAVAVALAVLRRT
jgi:hypothetical protein